MKKLLIFLLLCHEAALLPAQDVAAFVQLGHNKQGNYLGFVYSAVYSSSGKWIATGGGDTTVKLWDAETGKETRTLYGHTSEVRAVAFSPDEKRIAASCSIVFSDEQSVTRVWNIEDGRELFALKGHTGGITCVAFSPDGKTIITGSYDGTVRLWDAETGGETAIFPSYSIETSDAWWRRYSESFVYSLACSPDGEKIAAGYQDGQVRIWQRWEAKMWESLKDTFESPWRSNSIQAHTKEAVDFDYLGSVYSVSFSPDGKRLVTGSRDKTVKIWDVETETELFCLQGHENEVSSVSFSPDGKRIASGAFDGAILIWDAETGDKLHSINGQMPSLSV